MQQFTFVKLMRLCIAVALLLVCALPATHGSASSSFYKPKYSVTHDTSIFTKSWDVIIVGAGGAGSVLANRLSANCDTSVLLLEAGGPGQRATGGTHGGTFRYVVNSNGGLDLDGSWTLYDVPNLNAVMYTTPNPLDPTSPKYPDWVFQGYPALAAKVLGGSQAHNGMLWYRATPQNFAAWNVNGWSYADMLPYFKKSENVSSSRIHPGDPFHGFSGPIQLIDPAIIEPEGPIFCNATVNTNPARFKYVNDLNGNQYAGNEGCGYLYPNIRGGIRDSAVVAYLFNTEVILRDNLQVRAYAQVLKVNFDEHNKAESVDVYDMNTKITHTITANKVVVLSAGALNSPRILLQSGIGPAADLAAVHVPLVYNNSNVGRGIRSSPAVQVTWEVPNITHPNFFNQGDQSVEYAISGTGMLASTQNSWIAAIKSNIALNSPDVALLGGGLDPGHLFGNRYSIIVAATDPPLADGYVKLLNNNPLSNNLFYFQNYSTPLHNGDVAAITVGIETVRSIMSHAPANTHFTQELIPGPLYSTSAQISQWVRTNLGETYHYATSVRMGNPGDPLAVVDNHTRVIGVSNLVVVDASIFPNSTHGWMEATVIGVAERAADLIIADFGL